MLIDIHVHSNHTQGCSNTIAELVAETKKRSLDGFCLTDMHTVAGAAEAKRLATEAGLVALVGFEAVTDKGHYLVFVPEPEALPDVASWLGHAGESPIPFDSLTKAVQAKAGVLIAAHPYDREVEGAPGDGVLQLSGVAALEVDNSRRSDQVNQLAEEVAAGTGMPGVAGSDTRQGSDTMGRSASLVQGRVETEAELIARIKAFDIWPVQIGPIKPPRREQSRRPRPARNDSRDGRSRRRDSGGRSDRRSDGRSRGRDGGGRSGQKTDGRSRQRSNAKSSRGPSDKRGSRPPKKD